MSPDERARFFNRYVNVSQFEVQSWGVFHCPRDLDDTGVINEDGELKGFALCL